VPEWHPGGHGLHVHFGVGRYIPQRLIRDVWGRGHVHIKLIGDLPVGSGTLAEARASGGYLAKYAGKAVDGMKLGGLHRYEVAQGFQPRAVPLEADSSEAAIDLAAELMGGLPARVWRASNQEGWLGPPAIWLAWDR
jgi:hypothetical protein